jgi:serpin B
MTYAGAQGTTATQMAQVLQLDADAGSAFEAQNALSQALAGRAAAALQEAQNDSPTTPPSPSDYQLQVVDSVWGEKTYPWASSFLDVLAQSYGSGVYLEDFVGNPAGAENTINAWVSYETADKINDLLPQGTLTSDTRIVLVNAIHLKLPWEQPFLTSATANGTFTRGDGSTVTTSFMNQTLQTSYVETADAQVVSLPLSGSQASVVFALPKNGLSALVSSLTPTTWASMTAATAASVTISLPKFDFTSPTFSLATALKALGMTAAFDPTAANFKGLCATTPDGDNIYIADILQKATMAVAENGVEAAAATAVIGAGSAAPSKQVTISFDQPFLVSIVDSSGAILFLGQIDDPTASGSQ